MDGNYRRDRRSVVAIALVAAAACCAGAAGEASEWFDQRVAGVFNCRSEFSLAEADRLLDDVQRLQADLIQQLGVPQAKEPIELYLFRDKASYGRFLAHYYPKVPYRRALYVKERGQGRVFAHRSPQFEVDVRHECTHALLHAALPMVPLWLDEGLAEYFEVAPERRAVFSEHQNGIGWAITLGTLPRLESLERKGGVAEMGQAEYRAAWAWVHFMLHESSAGRAELVKFLGDIQAGAPPGLLSRRLSQQVPNLPGRFAAHFRNWNWQ